MGWISSILPKMEWRKLSRGMTSEREFKKFKVQEFKVFKSLSEHESTQIDTDFYIS